MAVAVETLDKLERKMTLSLPLNVIESEVSLRLKKMARTVKMDGFRPGKVPMSVVAQRYGYSVQMEVINDKVGEVFFNAAHEAQLRVAGQPKISEKAGATAEGELVFEAVFEVYPEVKIADLSGTVVNKVNAEVNEAAVDKTLEILRKQRRTFSQRPQEAQAALGDRVGVDFEGKIDGEPFAGGKAQDFQFILGDAQMLKEFEDATLGLRVGESKTFALTFPADYRNSEVAGKTADFMVTVKKIEASHLPEINDALAKSFGLSDASVQGLRDDIRKNLEREVKTRVQARNKVAVMEALLAQAELDLPKASVQLEIDRLREVARAELKQRGLKDADKVDIPEDAFIEQAQRRVRLGLVLAELVRANKLKASMAQIQAHVDELAASYEKPAEVSRWYFSDNKRLAEVEAMVLENNVTDFVLSKAQVTETTLDFEELMAQR